MSFGKRVAEIRKERNLSQVQLAQLINTSAPVIGRYERNLSIPSIAIANKLAKTLDVSLDYLVGNINLPLDLQLLKRLEEVQELDEEVQQHIMYAFEALLRDAKAQKTYS